MGRKMTVDVKSISTFFNRAMSELHGDDFAGYCDIPDSGFDHKMEPPISAAEQVQKIVDAGFVLAPGWSAHDIEVKMIYGDGTPRPKGLYSDS
jgi:hypothetical protein